MTSEAQRLLELAERLGALTYGEFTLSSGKVSPYYFDGRLLTLDPEGTFLIGRAFLPVVRDAGAEAVGGPTLGADPMATAIALTSHLEGTPIPAFIVRKEAKGHGAGRAIEGPLPVEGCKVAVVDDTCTSGGSLLHAIDAAEAAGCTVVMVAAILDRREGGSDEIRRRGYPFWTLLEATPDGKVKPAD